MAESWSINNIQTLPPLPETPTWRRQYSEYENTPRHTARKHAQLDVRQYEAGENRTVEKDRLFGRQRELNHLDRVKDGHHGEPTIKPHSTRSCTTEQQDSDSRTWSEIHPAKIQDSNKGKVANYHSLSSTLQATNNTPFNTHSPSKHKLHISPRKYPLPPSPPPPSSSFSTTNTSICDNPPSSPSRSTLTSTLPNLSESMIGETSMLSMLGSDQSLDFGIEALRPVPTPRQLNRVSSSTNLDQGINRIQISQETLTVRADQDLGILGTVPLSSESFIRSKYDTLHIPRSPEKIAPLKWSSSAHTLSRAKSDSPEKRSIVNDIFSMPVALPDVSLTVSTQRSPTKPNSSVPTSMPKDPTIKSKHTPFTDPTSTKILPCVEESPKRNSSAQHAVGDADVSSLLPVSPEKVKHLLSDDHLLTRETFVEEQSFLLPPPPPSTIKRGPRKPVTCSSPSQSPFRKTSTKQPSNNQTADGDLSSLLPVSPAKVQHLLNDQYLKSRETLIEEKTFLLPPPPPSTRQPAHNHQRKSSKSSSVPSHSSRTDLDTSTLLPTSPPKIRHLLTDDHLLTRETMIEDETFLLLPPPPRSVRKQPVSAKRLAMPPPSHHRRAESELTGLQKIVNHRSQQRQVSANLGDITLDIGDLIARVPKPKRASGTEESFEDLRGQRLELDDLDMTMAEEPFLAGLRKLPKSQSTHTFSTTMAKPISKTIQDFFNSHSNTDQASAFSSRDTISRSKSLSRVQMASLASVDSPRKRNDHQPATDSVSTSSPRKTATARSTALSKYLPTRTPGTPEAKSLGLENTRRTSLSAGAKPIGREVMSTEERSGSPAVPKPKVSFRGGQEGLQKMVIEGSVKLTARLGSTQSTLPTSRGLPPNTRISAMPTVRSSTAAQPTNTTGKTRAGSTPALTNNCGTLTSRPASMVSRTGSVRSSFRPTLGMTATSAGSTSTERTKATSSAPQGLSSGTTASRSAASSQPSAARTTTGQKPLGNIQPTATRASTRPPTNPDPARPSTMTRSTTQPRSFGTNADPATNRLSRPGASMQPPKSTVSHLSKPSIGSGASRSTTKVAPRSAATISDAAAPSTKSRAQSTPVDIVARASTSTKAATLVRPSGKSSIPPPKPTTAHSSVTSTARPSASMTTRPSIPSQPRMKPQSSTIPTSRAVGTSVPSSAMTTTRGLSNPPPRSRATATASSITGKSIGPPGTASSIPKTLGTGAGTIRGNGSSSSSSTSASAQMLALKARMDAISAKHGSVRLRR